MLMLLITQPTEYGVRPDKEELEKLLLEVADGKQDALAALYERTRSAVYALALSILKNSEDAQDVTQDAFVRIWDSAPLYRPQGSPIAWILTVARNLARMKLRTGARQLDLSEEQWSAIPAEAPSVTPEDKHILQDALSTLSDEERQIVLLHASTGLKHREIAELLEFPLATVLSKYHRALKKLRNFVEGDETP